MTSSADRIMSPENEILKTDKQLVKMMAAAICSFLGKHGFIQMHQIKLQEWYNELTVTSGLISNLIEKTGDIFPDFQTGIPL